MKNRNLIVVALLSLFTSGIYSIFWLVVTKEEIKNQGINIPSALLLAVPLVNIWWLWKYSQGVEKITKGAISGLLAFVLLMLITPLGILIIQDSFNNTTVATDTGAPVAPAPPAIAPNPAQAPIFPSSNPTPPTDSTSTPPTNPVG